MMIKVEFSVQTRHGTSGTVFIKKRSTRFGVLEVVNGSRSQDLGSIFEDEVGVYLVDLYIFDSRLASNSMYKYQKLTAIFCESSN